MRCLWAGCRPGRVGSSWMEQRNQNETRQGRTEQRLPRAEKLTLEKGGSPDEKAGWPHLSPWAPLKKAFSLSSCPGAYLNSMSQAERPPAKMQSGQQSGWRVCLCDRFLRGGALRPAPPPAGGRRRHLLPLPPFPNRTRSAVTVKAAAPSSHPSEAWERSGGKLNCHFSAGP